MQLDTQKHEVPLNLRPKHADRHMATVCRRACDPAMLMDIWSSRQEKGVTLHVIHAMQVDMWTTRCRHPCVRSHANRRTGCHTLACDSLRFPIYSPRPLIISPHPEHFKDT